MRHILVYNTSHADVLFQLGDEWLARPRFNVYRSVTRTVLESIATPAAMTPATRRHSIDDVVDEDADNVVDVESVNWAKQAAHAGRASELRVLHFPVAEAGAEDMAVGLELPTDGQLDGLGNANLFKDRPSGVGAHEAAAPVGVFFPLIAVVVRQWLARARPDDNVTLILVSGSGTPRNANDHPVDNSTQFAAILAELFLRRAYGGRIDIARAHSSRDIFHFDANVAFFNNRVRPLVDAQRRALAAEYHEHWADHLSVSVALTEGAPARLAALATSMRAYRPATLHAWQLKRFMCDFPNITSMGLTDVEYHPFETTELSPAMSLGELAKARQFDGKAAAAVAAAMAEHRADFERHLSDPKSEIMDFWLRKTGKPVLSILYVQPPGKEPRIIRSINVEVSMPTGSLCAERNAIGTALASDLSLRREDMKMIGVLSMQDAVLKWKQGRNVPQSPQLVPTEDEHNPIRPCGACREWLKKITEVNPDFVVVTFTDTACEHVFVESV